MGELGGLTVDEAYARFCENPSYYQEDFMFMGGKAFAFYFPVVEKYLLSVPDLNDDGSDHEAWILAKGIGWPWAKALRPVGRK